MTRRSSRCRGHRPGEELKGLPQKAARPERPAITNPGPWSRIFARDFHLSDVCAANAILRRPILPRYNPSPDADREGPKVPESRKKCRADTVAHGAHGKGNDQYRFEFPISGAGAGVADHFTVKIDAAFVSSFPAGPR